MSEFKGKPKITDQTISFKSETGKHKILLTDARAAASGHNRATAQRLKSEFGLTAKEIRSLVAQAAHAGKPQRSPGLRR